METMENKVALVTAASKGIGLACALTLAQNGAWVFMAVRNVKEMEHMRKLPINEKLKLTPVYFDATKKETFSSIVKETLGQAGKIDILVNNFGIGKPAEDLHLIAGTENSFFEILDMNLGSVYRLCKLVIPHMIENGSGSIINISSIGGLVPDISRIGYGVSKAAINNITQQIALQYAHENIRCNAVLPGLTSTEAAMKNMPKEFLDSFLSHIPLRRMATPEDIANAVLFFASERSSYITGHILDVAGGYGLGTPQYAEMMNRQKDVWFS